MKIGKKLRIIRTIKGIKQNVLAEKIGVTNIYLSSIENDKNEPSLSFIENVSKILNVPLTFFFMEENIGALDKKNREIINSFNNILEEFVNLKHVKAKK